jgi:serine/threonine protein kinase
MEPSGEKPNGSDGDIDPGETSAEDDEKNQQQQDERQANVQQEFVQRDKKDVLRIIVGDGMFGKTSMMQIFIQPQKDLGMAKSIFGLTDEVKDDNLTEYLFEDDNLTDEDRLCEEGSFPEAASVMTVTQLLSAVKFLHQRGIVHRDLKPENITDEVEDDIFTDEVEDDNLKMNNDNLPGDGSFDISHNRSIIDFPGVTDIVTENRNDKVKAEEEVGKEEKISEGKKGDVWQSKRRKADTVGGYSSSCTSDFLYLANGISNEVNADLIIALAA